MPDAFTTNQHRICFLDALRGIAVLCIFIANIGYFSGTFFIGPNERFPWAVLPSDDIVDFILFAAIDGKFYTVFSLLFGIGCALQFHGMEQRDQPFKPFFRRRMFWLLLIGLTHLCLIWLGDILTLYALLGFVLVYFVRTKNENLIKYAAILILLPILNDVVINGLGWDYAHYVFQLKATAAKLLDTPQMDTMGDYVKNENWMAFFKSNLSNVFIRVSRMLEEGRPFKVFGIFLIGLWAGRKITTENLLDNRALLKKVAWFGICIGLPFSIARTYFEFFNDNGIWGFLKTVSYALGTVPLALGYAALLALQYKRNPVFLRLFEPVGKMALTNYISQTIISITIFYGIGFGYAGRFGFTIIFAIALLVFIVQVITSMLWLSTFRQGPIEWFWRYATNRR